MKSYWHLLRIRLFLPKKNSRESESFKVFCVIKWWIDIYLQYVLPLVVATGPLWALPVQHCSWQQAAPATVCTTVWEIWIGVGRKTCLHSYGAQGEASFEHWWWSLCGTRSGGAGQVVEEEEVYGLEEVREQGMGSCPRTQRWHQNVPDAGSQSSGQPRCTAGRAGQHLGDRGGKTDRETQQKRRGVNKKRRLKNTGSKGKMIDRDRNSVCQKDSFVFDILFYTHLLECKAEAAAVFPSS